MEGREGGETEAGKGERESKRDGCRENSKEQKPIPHVAKPLLNT